MKYYLSLGAAIAALALTTGTGVAQSNPPGSTYNSSGQASPGHAGSMKSKTVLTKKQAAAMKGKHVMGTSQGAGKTSAMELKHAKSKSMEAKSITPGSAGSEHRTSAGSTGSATAPK